MPIFSRPPAKAHFHAAEWPKTIWIKYLVNYQHQDLIQQTFGYSPNDCDHWAMCPLIEHYTSCNNRQTDEQTEGWMDKDSLTDR